MSLANPTETEARVLHIKRRFTASRDAVFSALTDPEALAQWFGPEGVTVKVVSLDLRPGGGYSFEFHGSEGGFHALTGSYLEIERPKRLVATWIWGQGDYAGVETRVTYELSEVDGGTELSLTHENLVDAEARDKHDQGWTSTLGCLERFLQANKATEKGGMHS